MLDLKYPLVLFLYVLFCFKVLQDRSKQNMMFCVIYFLSSSFLHNICRKHQNLKKISPRQYRILSFIMGIVRLLQQECCMKKQAMKCKFVKMVICKRLLRFAVIHTHPEDLFIFYYTRYLTGCNSFRQFIKNFRFCFQIFYNQVICISLQSAY